MNKFKALIIKDFTINRKTLFTPFWITLGFYALILISLAIGYFKGDMTISGLEYMQDDVQIPALIFAINMGLVGLPGLIAVLFTITLTQSALNDDLKRNCELFHRSQPVSYWLRSLSKYTVSIGGNWLVLLVVTLFNFLVVNIILAFFGQFSLGASLSGMLVSYLYFLKVSLLIGSITFLFSAIFKDKSFFTGVGILLGIQFLFMLLNLILGWKLPLPLKYITDLFSIQNQMNLEGDPSTINYVLFVKEAWRMSILNWKSVLQLAVSAILFALSTIIYNSKEVK